MAWRKPTKVFYEATFVALWHGGSRYNTNPSPQGERLITAI